MNTPSTACERLALTRENLRQAINPTASIPRIDPLRNPANSLRALLTNLKSATSVRLIQLVFRTWWRQHPLRVALMLSARAAEVAVQPIAKTHPLVLMLGSALVGAALFRTRPWRWVPVSAVFAGLLPRLVSALSNQNKSL